MKSLFTFSLTLLTVFSITHALLSLAHNSTLLTKISDIDNAKIERMYLAESESECRAVYELELRLNISPELNTELFDLCEDAAY